MRTLFLSLLACIACVAALRAAEEPVKITEIKLKDGSTLRALKMSILAANGMRSYTVVSLENKRIGLQQADVLSHKEVVVAYEELPEAARAEVAKQRATEAQSKAAASAKTATKADGKGDSAKTVASAGAVAPGFQSRMDRPADPVIDKALAWLAANQDADGRWSSAKGGAEFQQDTAVTGLALMALLGSGHSEKTGGHKDTVRKGLAWLKAKQSADGLVYDATDHSAVHRAIGYPHAIATIALCEAAGMGGAPDTRMAAQKAIDYALMKHQHDDGGWRYRPGMEGCLSVSGWYFGAMRAAKHAGLRFQPGSVVKALEFINGLGHKIEGAPNSVRVFWYMSTNEHSQTQHCLTMIGCSGLAGLGFDDPGLRSSVERAIQRGGLPRRGANGESANLYYWYYGTQAAFYAGDDVYTPWSEALTRALNESQQDDGSFPPIGNYSGEWGKVGQTALSVLCLQMPFRYPKGLGK